VATLVAAAWLIQRGSLHIPTTALERLRSLTGSHPSATPHTGGHTTAGSSVGTGEWVAAGVIWVLLAIAAATWWLRRPRVEPAAARVAEPAAAEAPPASTIEDVRAEPDPARAVIGAYALMERLLGDSGHGRRPSEAPLEYLHRVGGELPAASPAAAAITRLYLRARFAGRAVDRSAKAEAVAALERLAGAGSAP